ncbi:MAG: response regulator [Flavobacteriales bacterium]|nr:response regulator [Flavobacteriales bacterium]
MEHPDNIGLSASRTVASVHQAMMGKSHLPMAQVVGRHHVISSVNAAFCHLLGSTAKELIGRPFAELVPLGAECLNMVDDVYRTGVARSHVKAREDQMDPVYWSYTCLPVKGAANEPLGVLVQVTETSLFNARNTEINEALLISSVKQHELTENAERLNDELQLEIAKHEAAEALLRKNRDTFFGLIEKAPFGLYVVDSQFRLQHVSSGAEHVFSHITPHIGRDFAEILALVWEEPFVGQAIARFRHTLATGEPYAEKELTERRKDIAEVESYDWRIERITLPDGQFGVVCYFYDISDHTKAQELLRVADRRKSEFLATLAHELRNPLAPLRNGLELLALSEGDRSTWDKAHGMMKRQLDQMVRLIDELLDLSRITRGAVDLQRLRVDLHTVLDQAVETSRPVIEQQQHRLVLDIPTTPMFVDGDGMRLAQVFNNLLNNAAKYTDRGGLIRLKAMIEGNDVVVSIADNGIGISAQDQGRVFDMFAQVERAQGYAQGGLGIGLNIVKHLVEMHGGRIDVASGGPEKGSCFTVHLPVATSTELDASVPVIVERPTTPTRKRILIVDDNEDAATMMAFLLKKLGHEVHVAHDGVEALTLGQRIRPEVVLMDIGMPVMDGITACVEMRRHDWGKAAYLVALTGWGQEEDKVRSRKAGFDEHLVKPIGSEVLRVILAKASGAKARTSSGAP